MFTRHIALVSQFAAVDAAALASVSAAIQRQVVQDLTPIWEVSATVAPFPSLADVPAGYWPIIITAAGLPSDLLGLHRDENGQPIAWVEWSDSWSITASHECLEMLVDPWGNQLQAARDPRGGDTRVEYLVEVCDPCQDARFAYSINDILVSDFYTPAFFDRIARSGVRYSLTGAIEKPLQVLQGGYLSFRRLVDEHWYQVASDGHETDLGTLKPLTASLRELIDGRTPGHLAPTRIAREEVQRRVGARRASAKQAARVRADRLQALLNPKRPEAHSSSS